MDAKMKKAICLLLLGGCTLFFILSCSSMNNILGWSKSPESRETAISQFLSNTRPHQGNSDSHYLLACYYQERGRHKEAIEEFKKVLLIDPNYLKAYNGLGVSYDLLGDFPKAIEYYKNALTLDPNMGYVYNNLGYSYLLQGNFDEAIIVLKRAIDIDGQDQRSHNNLGLAYGEKGQYELALTEFKHASDEAKAHHNMAQLYFKKGLFDEAKSHYAIALKLNPSLTIVRTGLRAADALVRIFEPTPNKAEPKQLAIPDQTEIKAEEIEKIVTAHRLSGMMPTSDESMPPVDPATMNLKKEELLTPEQSNAKNNEHEKLKVVDLANALLDPSSSQKTNLESTENLYELQVASFRSKENAIHAARSIQELGYHTNILSGGNGNGNKDRWYRLITGPYETKDKALTHKVKIEEEYPFNPWLKKVAVGKHESIEIPISKPIADKGKIVHLKGVNIEISNGNGVYQMARKLGDYLNEKGFKVTRLTNANNFRYTETRIYFQKEYDSAAEQVAEHLPAFRSKEEAEKFDRPNIKIKILIGKDLIPHHKTFENGKKS